jgi:hypothetical protein
MKTIDHKGLLKLVRKAEYFLGSFPGGHENYDESGWQLTIGYRVPLKAGGKKVGEQRVTHTITFPRGGMKAGPEHFAHWDYWEANSIKILLETEIKAALKRGGEPHVTVCPTLYGSEREMAMARACAGKEKPVYTISFQSIRADLNAWGAMEPAGHWGHDQWRPLDAQAEESVDSAHFSYRFGEEMQKLEVV